MAATVSTRLAACSPAPSRNTEVGGQLPRPSTSSRGVNFGFESVVDGSTRSADWGEVVPLLDATHATAVSLVVGRPDWVAFPWAAHPDAESTRVRESGTDYIRAALDALPDHLEVTLTIDALAPRLLEEDRDLAGVTVDGEHSESFASVAALDGGAVGDRIVELARHIAGTYRPDRVSLTELMFDDATFGDADLRHFREHTGRTDWPRRGGEIDTGADIIAEWRSAALANLLGRVVEAVSGEGVSVDMDVRAPQDDPTSDRSLSGHDYELLLDTVDRLVVWNYPGLSRAEDAVDFSAEFTRELLGRHPGRIVISTGLWARNGGELSARELERALDAVTAAGATAVSVTPASMLSDAHWDVLVSRWS